MAAPTPPHERGALSRFGAATGRGFGWLMKLVLPAVILSGAVIGLQTMRDGDGGRGGFERREEAAPVRRSGR